MIDKLNLHYSFTTPASIHDEEALTSLELAGRQGAKINELIDDQNKLRTETEKTLNVTIPKTISEEVQNHINNGAFDEQIDEYAGELSDRLDNLLGTVTEGTSTMDAEVIDGRLGADGKTYDSLGTANRTQLNNKPDLASVHVGVYIGATGSTSEIIYTTYSGGAGIQATIPGKLTFRAKGVTFGGCEWADMVTNLETTYYSLTGDGGCVINLPYYLDVLVYNVTSGKVAIRGYNTTQSDDIVLLINGFGHPCGGLLMRYIDTLKFGERIESKVDMKTSQLGLYIGATGSDSPLVCTREGTSATMTVVIPGKITFRGKGLPAKALEWLEVSDSSLTPYITTDEDGTTATIKLTNYGDRLVYNVDTGKLCIRTVNNNVSGDIVLLVNGYGQPCGGILMRYVYTGRIADLETRLNQAKITNLDDETRARIEEYSSLFNNTENVESFLYYTDPHLAQFTGDAWRDEFITFTNQLKKVYDETPVSRVFCGGDWLGNSELQTEACYRLGLVDATMRSMFTEYHSVLGNHDTNYQGKLDVNSERGTGRLGQGTIRNLLYRREGKPYYKVKSSQTTFYVIDTQIEGESITAYGYEQAHWFATELLSETGNIAVLPHIIYYNTSYLVQPLTALILQIAQAYNNRQSITVNGITYNFASGQGKVRYCIGGHIHEDKTTTLYGIPCVITTHMRDGGVPTYDLCLANYDTNKLHLVRVGTGQKRIVDI